MTMKSRNDSINHYFFNRFLTLINLDIFLFLLTKTNFNIFNNLDDLVFCLLIFIVTNECYLIYINEFISENKYNRDFYIIQDFSGVCI